MARCAVRLGRQATAIDSGIIGTLWRAAERTKICVLMLYHINGVSGSRPVIGPFRS